MAKDPENLSLDISRLGKKMTKNHTTPTNKNFFEKMSSRGIRLMGRLNGKTFYLVDANTILQVDDTTGIVEENQAKINKQY